MCDNSEKVQVLFDKLFLESKLFWVRHKLYSKKVNKPLKNERIRLKNQLIILRGSYKILREKYKAETFWEDHSFVF